MSSPDFAVEIERALRATRTSSRSIEINPAMQDALRAITTFGHAIVD
jgi:hypothetical protein